MHSNRDIYKFSLAYGCLPSHGKDVLRALIEDGRLPEQKMPPVSYDAWKSGKERTIELRED